MLKPKFTKLSVIAAITITLTNMSPVMGAPNTGRERDTYVNWTYINKDGSWILNKWKQIDGKWYYFGGGGRAAKGYRAIGSSDPNKPFYYFNENGVWNGKGPYAKEEVDKLDGKEIQSQIQQAEYKSADEVFEAGHSIKDIVNKWNELKPTFNKNIYIEEPYTKFPYKVGKVDDGYLNDTLNYLNFARYLANLEPVYLDSTLTQQAQYAAVLTDANNQLKHVNPVHPPNMSNDFYNLGKESTSSSNLSGGKLLESIQDCINENNNLSGMDNIGHREWLLDPNLTKIGFGTTTNYSAQKLPLGEFATDIDAPDYLAWPSEGAFPNKFIDKSSIWSINLSRDVYHFNSIDDISIKITRLSDNKQWNLQKITNFSRSISGFRLSSNDNNRYGSSTLIFHIAYDQLMAEKYLGEYKVEISGLKNVNDEKENINYIINFFDLDKAMLKNNS